MKEIPGAHVANWVSPSGQVDPTSSLDTLRHLGSLSVKVRNAEAQAAAAAVAPSPSLLES